MNAVPASIKAAAEPQVNLLPPEVEARRAHGRQKGLLAIAFFAFLLLLGVAAYWASSQEATAKRDLQSAVDEGDRLQAKIDEFQYVLDMETELNNARNARTYVASTEIDHKRIMYAVGSALPDGVTLESMNWSTVSVTNPTGTDSLSSSAIGSVTIRGALPTYVSGADLEEALNEVPGLTSVRITTEQKQGELGEGGYYAFDGSARVTALALSGRFSAAWLKDAAIDRAVEVVEVRLTEAYSALTTAEDLTAARATYSVAANDYDQVMALVLRVVDAEIEVSRLQDAVAYEEEGADEALLAAETALGELAPVLDSLAKAVNAWDEDSRSLKTIEARIVAAEEYVEYSEKREAAAMAAVFAGDEGADAVYAQAHTWLLKATYGLALEQSFLAAAKATEAETRTALDEVLAMVADPDLVAGSTGGEE